MDICIEAPNVSFTIFLKGAPLLANSGGFGNAAAIHSITVHSHNEGWSASHTPPAIIA